MSLKSIKSNLQASDRGFTIVELLIVVVVIAVLAAITIVSYNGITNRANASAAEVSAKTVVTKAEAFQADGGNAAGTYPASRAELISATSDKVYSGLTSASFVTGVGATLPTSASKTLVQYLVCGANALSGGAISGAVVGGRVAYWNYAASGAAVAYKDIGTVTPANCTAV